MKHLPILAALIGALALNAAIATAGPDGDRQQRHQAHKERMQEQFGITDEQFEQMHEIRRNGGSREEAAAVLSDDQRAQMQQWRKDNPEKARKMKQHRERHREHRGEQTAADA